MPGITVYNVCQFRIRVNEYGPPPQPYGRHDSRGNDWNCPVCDEFVRAARCRDRDGQDYDESYEVRFVFSKSMLAIYAGDGCPTCQRLLHASELQRPDYEGQLKVEIRAPLPSKCQLIPSNRTSYRPITFYMFRLKNESAPDLDSNSGKASDTPAMVMSLHGVKPWAAFGYRLFSRLSYRVRGFGGCLKTAQEWLQDCQRFDRCCKVNPGSPSRLLQVKYEKNSAWGATYVLRLREFRSRAHRTRYACLSYCWGKELSPQTLRLTSDTFLRLKRGFLLSLLPRTIREAVSVAVWLGFQYIWVDSLCIFQDRRDDWHAQASEMASIYGGCELCITVASSPHSNHGFLDQLNWRPELPYSSVCRRSEHDAFYWPDIAVSEQEDDKRLASAHAEWAAPFQPNQITDVEHANPLSLRAWALQEHLLPMRSLHFGKHELVWECRARLKCECGLIDVHESGSGHLSADRIGQINGLALPRKQLWSNFIRPVPARTAILGASGNTAVGRNEFQQREVFWAWLVGHYTKRRISDEGDRLVALDGLVNALQPVWGKCYAGHWQFNIVSSLIWRPAKGSVSQPAKYRAPSFSWASLEYSVGVRFFDETQVGTYRRLNIARFKRCECYYIGAKGLGPLSYGYLELMTSVIELSDPEIVFHTDMFWDTTQDFGTRRSSMTCKHTGPVALVFATCSFDKHRFTALLCRPSSKGKDTFERIGSLCGNLDEPNRPESEFERTWPIFWYEIESALGVQAIHDKIVTII